MPQPAGNRREAARSARVADVGKEYSLGEWRAKGLGEHSIIADPQFVDRKNRNFALKPDSPAFELGFKPIDISAVGPRK